MAKHRLTKILLTAGLALGLVGAGAGVAFATIPDSSGTIHACYKNSTGALSVIDTGAGQSCGSGETALNWSGALSYYTKTAGPDTVGPQTGDTNGATCNSGDAAVGGGATMQNGSASVMRLVATYPDPYGPPPVSWSSTVWNTDPTNSWSVTYYAVCAHQG